MNALTSCTFIPSKLSTCPAKKRRGNLITYHLSINNMIPVFYQQTTVTQHEAPFFLYAAAAAAADQQAFPCPKRNRKQ